MKGTIKTYNEQSGRGVAVLENGKEIIFRWDEVCYSNLNEQAAALRTRREGKHGDGRCILPGDRITFDANDDIRPITIVAGA
jgi:hypothetical protein